MENHDDEIMYLNEAICYLDLASDLTSNENVEFYQELMSDLRNIINELKRRSYKWG